MQPDHVQLEVDPLQLQLLHQLARVTFAGLPPIADQDDRIHPRRVDREVVHRLPDRRRQRRHPFRREILQPRRYPLQLSCLHGCYELDVLTALFLLPFPLEVMTVGTEADVDLRREAAETGGQNLLGDLSLDGPIGQLFRHAARCVHDVLHVDVRLPSHDDEGDGGDVNGSHRGVRVWQCRRSRGRLGQPREQCEQDTASQAEHGEKAQHHHDRLLPERHRA